MSVMAVSSKQKTKPPVNVPKDQREGVRKQLLEHLKTIQVSTKKSGFYISNWQSVDQSWVKEECICVYDQYLVQANMRHLDPIVASFWKDFLELSFEEYKFLDNKFVLHSYFFTS
jgi:hypothetical protein